MTPADGPRADRVGDSVEPSAPGEGSRPIEIAVSPERRRQIELESRSLLEAELLGRRLEFASRPYEAHVQLSNFCNMSCIMCWDGANPPLKRMSPELLARLEEQVAPWLSILIPYGGSEPLAITWDEARRLAVANSIDVCLTTNVQYLDEKTFHELKDIAETIFLSIDSHIPEVFEKIRPGSRRKKVFENLVSTARLCEENEVECVGQVVFLMQNAAGLDDTVRYLAKVGIPTVQVIPMLDVNGRSRMHDPLLHLSAEYVADVKERCIRAAEETRVQLIWSVGGHEAHDFRERRIGPTKRKAWNDAFQGRIERFLPGYCRFAYNRVSISSDGEVSPCCFDTLRELKFGDLGAQDLDEIWNSPNARDLRRAMTTGDVPTLCSSCRFHDALPPQRALPFLEEFEAERGLGGDHAPLEVLAPAHLLRTVEAPCIRLAPPKRPMSSYVLALSRGGEPDQVEVCSVRPVERPDGSLDLQVPGDLWRRLETNLGTWWAVWGRSPDGEVARTPELRCVIRHEAIPRLAGSKLPYPDEGAASPYDLGGGKQLGWVDRNARVERVAPKQEAPQELREEPPAPALPPGLRALAKRTLRRLGLVRG